MANTKKDESLVSLHEVVAILRFQKREDLAALLTNANLEWEFLDALFPATSDGILALTNAIIHAPISDCTKLRALPDDDHNEIFEAICEVWPATETGGTVIQNLSFIIDIDALTQDTTLLYTSSTGWDRVDRTMDRIRNLLANASVVEEFQQIGVLCREGLISLAEAVFDPAQHPSIPNDDTDVSKTDAKRMIARYVAFEYSGRSNREIRKCVNSALEVANKITHGRTSTYRDAAICAQATLNVVGLIAIISGKRDQTDAQLDPASIDVSTEGGYAQPIEEADD